ncbi:hypothetical protein AKI39_20495 [Bordetella sp. H567]|uniref:autotransporter outer membrane beta-barrel domain-containing protein n=1 Tax=Bordetella sp. H567 TaxID=1697043 RepID=UPI00081C98EA|nr:autotransporter outer membrane beta-barrel domain-containing protein [Bordetella sp. H567]AOB32604.1 hypothetical protein AKI39_20495 [Bordetella sp. H567]
MYRVTSFGLIAGPASLAYAGGPLKDYGPSNETVQATDGDADAMARVHGPIVTQQHHQHAIHALYPGSVLLSGPVSTQGDDAYALYYSGAARVIMTDVNIATHGARAHAVEGLRGDGAGPPGQAAAQPGDLELRRGRITLHGPGSVAMGLTTPSVRLGRPLRETAEATLWSMGYTGPASARQPDVRIDGKGADNVGIVIKGRRQLELNGVGIDLHEIGLVAMNIGASARVDGRNIGITASGADSFGLRVRGDGAGRDDSVRCPVPTSVKLANGFIAMTGQNSPAVEIVRAQVSLEDVSVTTSEAARFAVGNESGVFRMEGRQGRTILRSTGSALAAWTGSDRETARFDFRNVSIVSEAHSLLEVGRDHGDEGPAPPAHVDLSLDGGEARGRIWGGGSPAPRVNVNLRQGASWSGHTDVGRTVAVEAASTWNVDGDSVVENVVVGQGMIAFQARARQAEQSSDFHRLHITEDMRGSGEIGIRVDPASRQTDKVVVDGRVHDDIVIAPRDTGKVAETVTSMDLLHAAQGGPANYTLPDNAERVMLGGHAFRLHKEKIRDDPAVTVLVVPEGAPFIRGYATMDLEPPHRLRHAPPPTQGGPDRIDERDIPGDPPGPVQPPPVQPPVGQPPEVKTPDVKPPEVKAPEVKPPEIQPPGAEPLPPACPDGAHCGEPEGDTGDVPPSHQPGPETPTGEPPADKDPDGEPAPDRGGPDEPWIDAEPGPGGEPEAAPAPDAEPEPEPGDDADDEPTDETDAEPEPDKDEGETQDTEPSPAPEPPAPPPPPVVLSPAATLAVNNAALAAGQGIWNAQLAAVNRRLRAARHGNAMALPSGAHAVDAATGLWIDAAEGRQKIDNPLTGEYRQALYGFVAGVDHAIDVSAGRWHIGLLAAQIASRRDFDDGKGNTRSTHIGAYATFLGPRGSYATAIVSTGRYRHDMQGKFSDGKRLTGAFHNRGAGASLEGGRRVELPRAWFVEPYAGLDYLRVVSARYTLSDGTPVQDHGGHSLQWRTGARVGRAIEIRNGGNVTPYLRAGYAYERGNRNHVTVGETPLKANLGGSRLELGVGMEARLGKAHSLYVDVGYAKGRRFEQSGAVTIGFQYRW